MFVQSARFVAEHKRNGDSQEGTRAAATEISIYGQEKTGETVKLCRMNLAIHGLEGDVREANTYYEDPHQVPTVRLRPRKSTIQRQRG
jgi:type I restriction enzyme M protein